MPISTPTKRAVHGAKWAAAAASLLGLLAPAHAAWEASASVNDFDLDFLVSSYSGTYTWTTVREAWGATFGSNGSIPNEYIFRSWNGETWPQADFGGSVPLPGPTLGVAGWSREAATDELARSGEASVQGELANGLSAGAFALYEFRLDVGAFSNATVELRESARFAYLAHGAGDEGVAFAGFKLYAPGLDLNAPGGANAAYFNGQLALDGGDSADMVDSGIGLLSYTFENMTGSVQTHHLRFEISALVFTTPPVPEPQTWALWLVGLAGMGALARRRARQA